ncbi:MAG: ArnT family glycosyltransferase, partial [Hyphococcus sp.]
MTFLADDNSRLFLGLAALIVLGRVALLMMSPAALGPDESQYWYWSRDLDVGYFSKPPLIAWAIAGTTALFGDSEWAVRLSAPLFHGCAAVLLYAAARRLFDETTAFWTGLAWLTLPAVSLSSFVITTDAPLLFFWSAGLFILTRIVLAERAPVPAFAALGAAIGLGLLSKYAMLYFVIALAAATAFAPAVRRALWRAPLILTAVVAIALILPNIFWNAAHDFQTVSHTAANANWTENLFRLDGFATFLSAQLAVAGPVFFIA